MKLRLCSEVHPSNIENMNDRKKMLENLSLLLPKVNPSTILEYIQTLPPEVDNVVVPLTLSHFYDLEDARNVDRIAVENANHARVIHDLFPMYSVSKILNKLDKYGSAEDRCRLVIRHALKNCEEEMKVAEARINEMSHQNEIMEMSVDVFEDSRSESVTEAVDSAGYDVSKIDSNKGCEIEYNKSTSDINETADNQSASSEYQSFSPEGDQKGDLEVGNAEEDTSFVWEEGASQVYLEEKYDNALKEQLVSDNPTEETPVERLDLPSCSGISRKEKEIVQDSESGNDNLLNNDIEELPNPQFEEFLIRKTEAPTNQQLEPSRDQDSEGLQGQQIEEFDQNLEELPNRKIESPPNPQHEFQELHQGLEEFQNRKSEAPRNPDSESHGNCDFETKQKRKFEARQIKTTASSSACVGETSGIGRFSSQFFVAGEPVQFEPEEPTAIDLSTTGKIVENSVTDCEPEKKKRKKDEAMEEAGGQQTFNLIDFLTDFTSAPRKAIEDHCRIQRIDIDKKPSDTTLQQLVHYLMTTYDDSVVHIDERASTDEEVSSDDEGDEDNIPSVIPPVVVGLPKCNEKVISRLMEIFPDADPAYIRKLYGTMPPVQNEATMIDAIIEKMLEAPEYPKRPVRVKSPEEVDIEEQVEFVSELLPDADTDFIRMKATELSRDEFRNFVTNAVETKDYPTKKESLRKQQLSAQMRQYTTEFSVENYVKLVPDPVATFNNPERKIVLDGEDTSYVTIIFKNIFSDLYIRSVRGALITNDYQPYKVYKILKTLKVCMKTKRAKVPVEAMSCKNIPLLQELAFIQHEREVLDYVEKMKEMKVAERIRAKNEGLMLTCNCCFDEEVMPNDSHQCTNGCVFCKPCIVKSTEVVFGQGRLDFPCLGDCKASFSLNNLQDVLPPNLFSKIAQKKAVAEVKAAGVENLESCPFCDFATIMHAPPETNKIFTCQNPDCLKESCRLCKETSHVPLRCEEVEKDEDVKKRVFIENRMTEALLRKCWKCGVSFFKEEGCNKMTCSCGAKMCYICGKPVTDYKHFNGMGGDRHDLCPLYSDSVSVNKQNVLRGAMQAKAEIGASELKVDPTAGLDKHFEDRKKTLPREPHLQILERINARAPQAVPMQAAPQPIFVRRVVHHLHHNNPNMILHRPVFYPAPQVVNHNAMQQMPDDHRRILRIELGNMVDQVATRIINRALGDRGVMNENQQATVVNQQPIAAHQQPIVANQQVRGAAPRRRRGRHNIPNVPEPAAAMNHVPQMRQQQHPMGCRCRFHPQ